MSTKSGLNAVLIKNMNDSGYYGDGGGLYLQVRPNSKSWVFRYTSPTAGKRRDMGLGPIGDMPLAEARNIARELRILIRSGKDPIEERQRQRNIDRAELLKRKTLREVAGEFMDAHCAGFTYKQAMTWRSSFERHVYPSMGGLAVSAIDRPMIIRTLLPVFQSTPLSAKRLQNRVELVLNYAKSVGYLEGENPGLWLALKPALNSYLENAVSGHMESMNRTELPAFYSNLTALPYVAPRALQFLILTAARSGEVLGATWDEIDLPTKLWTIPGERMKMRRPHRVPLSESATQIIIQAKRQQISRFVFPGKLYNRPLSNMALAAVMRRLGRHEVPHGFRSTFKDWTMECTDFSDKGEMSEKALAHGVKNDVEAAYWRGDMLEKRRQLMEDWAGFCLGALGQ